MGLPGLGESEGCHDGKEHASLRPDGRVGGLRNLLERGLYPALWLTGHYNGDPMSLGQYVQCNKCGHVQAGMFAFGGLSLEDDMPGWSGVPFKAIMKGNSMSCRACGVQLALADCDIDEHGIRVSPKPGDARTWFDRFEELNLAVSSATSVDELRERIDAPEHSWARPVIEYLKQATGPANLPKWIGAIIALITSLRSCTSESTPSPQPIIWELPSPGLELPLQPDPNRLHDVDGR